MENKIKIYSLEVEDLINHNFSYHLYSDRTEALKDACNSIKAILIAHNISEPYTGYNVEDYEMFVKFQNLIKNNNYENALKLYSDWRWWYQTTYGISIPSFILKNKKIDESFNYYLTES